MGEVHRHRGGLGAVGQRQALAVEYQLRAAGVDLPVSGGDRAESPEGYIMSLVRLHEREFGVHIDRFMRALCDYYGVELHNFDPNSIS